MRALISRMRKGFRALKENASEPLDALKRGDTQLDRYLQYYMKVDRPEYAVLVTGEWGSGKTYQVKRAISEGNYYYISLFGMKSTEEIFASVFSAMFPFDAKTKNDLDTHKGTTLFGVPIGAIALQLSSVVMRDKFDDSKTIIFDDLERCRVRPTDLLGVINRYVEHHGCRVVVIAHDVKLPNILLEQNEKIFGQIIRIIPEIDEAYESFIGKFSNYQSDSPLVLFRPEIIDIFRESGVGSLRILRHVMEDTVRIYDCLLEKQREHGGLAKELIRFLAALNFEVRAGRIGAADLHDRLRKLVAARMGGVRQDAGAEPAIPLARAADRYPTVRLDNNLLSDLLLQEILFDGVYDGSRISREIANSAYFAAEQNVPAWRSFIEFQRQPDEVAEAAQARLDTEFADRVVIEPGEMLHVFALRFMMSANGLIPKNFDEVLDECKSYVDDLKLQSRLKPLPMAWGDRESLNHGYQGVSYWVEDAYSDKFKILFDYLDDKRDEVMIDNLKNYEPEILKLANSNAQKLYEILNFTASGDSTFASVPVLATIDPRVFVDSWLSGHPSNWYWVQSALQERLKHPNDRLNSELPWVKSLAPILEAEALKSKPIRAVRIRRHIPKITR